MRRVNNKSVFYSIAMVGAIAFLGYTLRGSSGSPTGAKLPGGVKLAAAAATAPAAPTTDRPVQAAPADADMKRYQTIVSRGIFSPPKPPDEGKTTVAVKPGPSFQSPIIMPPPGPPKPVDPGSLVQPITGWVYAGYYSLDGVTTGIIQNDNADSVKELGKGDAFQGYKVESITGDSMVLVAGSRRVTLERPADYSVVPLEGLTAQPQRPTPGRPGMGPRGGGG